MSEDENWDIFPPFEAFYLEMLLWHTTTAKVSIDIVGEWMELVKAEDEKALELKKPQLFGHLQNIIQQSGAISRYFWPSKAGKDSIHERRASRLRVGLQVDDNSPLEKRGLRNGLEHFDERLDIYLTKNFVGELVPEYVDYVEREHEIPLLFSTPCKTVGWGRNLRLCMRNATQPTHLPACRTCAQ